MYNDIWEDQEKPYTANQSEIYIKLTPQEEEEKKEESEMTEEEKEAADAKSKMI